MQSLSPGPTRKEGAQNKQHRKKCVALRNQKETTAFTPRANALWKADNSNFEDLKNVKVPVLVADGRYDLIDPPKNSLMIANQIPFAWLAFFDGGHSFVSQSSKQLSATVNAFLQ